MKKLLLGSIGVFAATAMTLAPIPAVGAEDRVSPNYRLNSDSAPYRGRDQVGLAVKPSDRRHVVAISANYLDSTCEASRSLDGGSTWSPAVALPIPAQGAAPEPFLPSCTNSVGTSQYVEFGSGDNVYTVAALNRRNSSLTSVIFYKSTDGGQSWQGSVAIEGGPQQWNRPSIAVDPGAASGMDRIHIVARVAAGGSGLKSIVSNNAGVSFSAPVDVNSPATAIPDFPPRPVVNPLDHSVSVVWRTSAVEGLLQASKSGPNGAQTWSTPVDITKVVNTGNDVTTHIPVAPGTTVGASLGASYPRLAGGPNDDLYLVFVQGAGGPTAPAGGYLGSDHFISYDSQVWFTRSLDGGATWSEPKRISDGTSLPGSRTHQTRHANVSVSPDGRINIVWHDRRHWFQGPGERNCAHSHIYCEDVRLGDTYYSYSNDGGNTFSPDIRINDRSQNSDVGYDTRPSGYWWFGPQSVTVDGGRELVGWMDSREGNWDTDTEDIYLAKVEFNATGNAPATPVDSSDAVSTAITLSKLGYMGGNEGALVGYLRDPANIAMAWGACPSTNPPTIEGCAVTGPASRNASAVVIVNENDAAGALAASVLARAHPGPVLLSPASGLPLSVRNEVARMRPSRAYVIGDATRLSDQVMVDVATAAGLIGPAVRLAGADSAATAAAIAEELDDRTAQEIADDTQLFDAAVIANPASPDAAAAAGLAAARRLPVLYVNADLPIPAQTQTALASLDIDETLVIGGTSSVSDDVMAALPSAKRVGGSSPYETSKAVVAESKLRGLPSNVVYVADVTKPMEATLLGGVAARATGILLLASTPLSATATGSAADAQLSGISRFFLLRPPPPPPPQPPPPPLPPPPPPPPPAVVPPPAAVPPPPPVAVPVEARPVLSGLSLTRTSFRARQGTKIRFTLSKDARVSIAVAQRRLGRRVGTRCVAVTPANRSRRSCDRYVLVGTLRSNRKKGANSVSFAGRVNGKLLKTGRYRFTLVATDSGGRTSASRVVSFRIVR